MKIKLKNGSRIQPIQSTNNIRGDTNRWQNAYYNALWDYYKRDNPDGTEEEFRIWLEQCEEMCNLMC